ncbi:hypothetical protein HCH_04284 [Hahella chejuensis KCTC 2396]|uniref:Uncharacterized protein n=1 Tax=Hahella chejuensis (strain KCTC 2396) TaxID=349521 RepID=Q2SED2_HAHCH|nr:hypothetical protein HCH_04284 [Hahella chejuensis KCTC 2396]
MLTPPSGVFTVKQYSSFSLFPKQLKRKYFMFKSGDFNILEY